MRLQEGKYGRTLVTTVGCLAPLLIAGAALGQLETIVLTDDPVPEGNGAYLSYGTKAINGGLDVAFQASLTGTSGGTADDTGLWISTPGGLVDILREGDASPDGNGTFSTDFFLSGVGATGSVLFRATLAGTSGGGDDDTGLFFRDAAGVLSAPVRGLDPAPGGGVFLDFFAQTRVSAADDITFFGNVDTNGNPLTAEAFGFFRVAAGGSVLKVVRTGDLAPGGGTFTPSNGIAPGNGLGQVAFFSSVSGGAPGLFRGDGVLPVVRIMSWGEGAPGGGTVSSTGALDMDETGTVLFIGNLSGGGAGIFSGSGGPLAELMRTGAPAPGGGTIDGLVVLRAAAPGSVVVQGWVGSNWVLFATDGVTTTEIARQGQAAPGGNGSFGSALTDWRVNAAGQVAFLCSLTGTVGGTSDDAGMFFWDGTLDEVVREGGAVEVAVADVRTVAAFNAIGSGSIALGMGDDGAVGVDLDFTDGSAGLFLARSVLNDSPATARRLVSGSAAVGSFDEAASQGTSTCDPGSVDLFYAIDVITGPAVLDVNTCGSTADTALAVFSPSSVEIGCNTACGGAPCTGPDACLNLPALPPGTYLIRVSAAAPPPMGSGGTFTVVATVTGGTGACCLPDQSCVDLNAVDCAVAGGLHAGDQTLCSGVSCSNDLCVDALPIGDGVTPFSTLSATGSGPTEVECAQGGDGGVTGNDIWYRYTASATGLLTVSTCEELGGSADYDTDLVLYEGSCSPLTLLACNDDDALHPCGGEPGFHSTVSTPVVSGAQYLIRVGGWSASDQGTGQLLVSCDATARPCCLPDGSCQVAAPDDCVAAGGQPDVLATSCADVLCAGPAACAQEVGANCQLVDTASASTSDLSTGFIVAENFTPDETGAITSVCFWGYYVDFVGGINDCAQGPGDTFRVTYYADDPPTTVVAGPFVGLATRAPTGAFLSGVAQYEFTVTHPPVAVAAGQCYWIEITNALYSDCDWLWASASSGDGRSYQDSDGDGYDAGDLLSANFAWCFNLVKAANPDPCVAHAIGACCLPDGSCLELSAADCLSAGGTARDTGVTCALAECPAPCPEDFLGDDGLVSVDELLRVLADWGPCGVPCVADINDDGFVNVTDLLAVLGRWGSCD